MSITAPLELFCYAVKLFKSDFIFFAKRMDRFKADNVFERINPALCGSAIIISKSWSEEPAFVPGPELQPERRN